MNLARLTEWISRYGHEGARNDRRLPGLTILRREAVSAVEAVVYEPVICLILQGRKQTSVGDQSVDLGPGDALLVSHDLPVLSRITVATRRQPYLAVILALDLGLVRGLHEQLADIPADDPGSRSLAAGRAEPAWIAPLERYLDLADNPHDARILGPGILREIHYRLLMSPMGGMLRNLLLADSRASRIA